MLLVILIAAAGVRLAALSGETLWIDEAASVFFARQSWSYLWNELPEYETNPPLYFMLLKAWIGLAGTSELALRAPSVVASVTVVFVIGIAGRVLGGAKLGWPLGLMAAAICALWHFQIVHGANVRAYAFCSLGAALMMTGALTLICRSRDSQIPVLRVAHLSDGATLSFMALALGSALTLWSHLLGVVPVLIIWLFLLLWWMIRHRCNWRLFWSLLAAGCTALALYAPYFPTLLSFVFRDQSDLSGIAWLDTPSFRRLAIITVRAFGQFSFPLGNALQAAIVAVLIALGAVGFWRVSRKSTPESRWVLGLILSMVVGHWLALVALTYSVQPVMVPRTLIFAQPPLILVLAAAPWSLSRGRGILTACLLAYISIGAFRPLHYVIQDHRDYRFIVESIAASDAPDAPVIIVPYYSEAGLLYYEDKLGVALNKRPYPESYYLPNRSIPEFDEGRVSDLISGLETLPTVWVLARRLTRYDPDFLIYDRLKAAGRQQTIVVPGARLDYDDTLSRFDLK